MSGQVTTYLLAVRTCGSNAAVITACKMVTGQSIKPWTVLTTPTQANRTVTPALKTRSPSTALRYDPASFDGRQAIPSAKRPTPTQCASGTPMPSGLAPNSSMHGTPGTVMKMAPTTISSHAAAMTMYRCTILVSLHMTHPCPDSRRLQHGVNVWPPHRGNTSTPQHAGEP